MKVPVKGYWGLLKRYLSPHRRLFFALSALLFTTISLQILNPQIVRYFIDSVTDSPKDNAHLTRAAIIFLILAAIQQGTTVASTYVGENLAWAATNHMRHDLADHCLHLDMSFHKVRTPGEMIERLDTDISALANFFSQFLVRVVGNTILLFGILLVLFLEDWRIGMPFTVVTIITIILLIYLRNIAIPHWEAAHQGSADVYGFLEERLAGTEDIRASGANKYVFDMFGEHLDNRAAKWTKAMKMNFRVLATIRMLNGVQMVIAMGVGYWLYTNGSITLGTAYLMVFYTNMLGRPMREISQQIQNLQRAGGSIIRVEELYQTRSKLIDGIGTKLPDGPLSVEFDKVTFRYDDEKDDDIILRDLSFEIPPGKIIGLLGRTGAGKTTISRLLFRLYDINEGTIKLGGVNLRDAHLNYLRRRVGMVTQDVQLFRATVRDNLTFFDKTIPDEKILEVLEDLGMMRWLNSLENGLDTLMESGGKSISAGEGQLLVFARVFLRNPGLVILDEASSRLDPATEMLIERAIDKLLANRTGIIIAHRLKTVQRADTIVILEDGTIKEIGDRVALMADPNSHFAQLLKTGLEEVLA